LPACHYTEDMTTPPTHGDAWYRARLAPPERAIGLATRPKIIIDTDAANEIDDQFALAWALLSSDQLDVQAVYATPFSFAHRRAALPHAAPEAAPFNPPAEGMERSYHEIVKVFGLLGVPVASRVLRGSTGYLPSSTQALRSEAVEHLIASARSHQDAQPLYVLALGCVTNIASALLLAPDIVERIVVVWTSGFPSHAPQVNHSFNLEQDLAASQVLLNSGVPHVYLPGYHVGAQLRLSLPEIERYVQGCGAIGQYLHHLFTHNPLWSIVGDQSHKPYSWVIWDVINIAWMLNPNWVPSELLRTPILLADKRWQADRSRHLMREAYAVQRDAIFQDFFVKLASA
jgi:purine nucleosidase